jgi:hypothetical protein
MPFDANGNYTSNTSGFTQPYQMGTGSLGSYNNIGANASYPQTPSAPYQFPQSGMSQPYQFGSQGNYMGYPSQPMSFANTGTPAAAPAAQPQTGGGGFNPIGFGLGAVQTGVALYQLNKLSKTPVPEYKASAGTLAANQRAQQMSQMGYTPSQTAAFKANMGTALNTQFANQRNLAGGNLAGALGARGTAQKLQSLNQFAAGDADRQMGNIRYADEQTAGLQRMQNMNTEAAMRRRLMTEQALGAAVQQGTVNMANSFDTGASFSKFASMMGGGMG